VIGAKLHLSMRKQHCGWKRWRGRKRWCGRKRRRSSPVAPVFHVRHFTFSAGFRVRCFPGLSLG